MGGLRQLLVAGGAGLWLAGCGSADPPEVRVRAVIDAAEAAAEARDVSALMDLVSPDYKDAEGRQPDELSRYLRGYFIANQSIHLLTRVESIEFPATGVAELALTVGMVGRDAEAQSAWDLAADVYRIDLTLMDREGDWLVTHVDAKPAGR
jgi:hypothetical protein